MKKLLSLIILTVSLSLTAAMPNTFTTGPQIKDFGANAFVDVAFPKDQSFKVAFDVGKQGETDKVNRNFDSLARFINMHVRAGVKPENIRLALVVHGKASLDVMNNDSYAEKFDLDNPNHDLINELLNNQVDIYLCGQSAAYYKVAQEDLQEGVQMALSAMTAHALLQQQGYTLNPF